LLFLVFYTRKEANCIANHIGRNVAYPSNIPRSPSRDCLVDCVAPYFGRPRDPGPEGDPEAIEFTNLQDQKPAAMIFERARIFTPVAPSWIAHTIRHRSSAVRQRPGTVTAVWLWCSISSSLKTASDVLPVQFL